MGYDIDFGFSFLKQRIFMLGVLIGREENRLVSCTADLNG